MNVYMYLQKLWSTKLTLIINRWNLSQMFNLTSWQFNSKLLICVPLCHNFEIRPKGPRWIWVSTRKKDWFLNSSTTEKGHIILSFASMINLKNKHGRNHVENDNITKKLIWQGLHYKYHFKSWTILKTLKIDFNKYWRYLNLSTGLNWLKG